MITITKYIEKQNAKGTKVVGHAFEFVYTNKVGVNLPAKIQFSQAEFEEKRASADTTVTQYFERKIRKGLDVADAPRQFKEVVFDTSDAIKTKLGADVIE